MGKPVDTIVEAIARIDEFLHRRITAGHLHRFNRIAVGAGPFRADFIRLDS